MKQYSILSALALLLVFSCKEHQEKSMAGGEDIPEEPINISRTLAGQHQKFSELPPLAEHINELIFWEDENFEEPAERLTLADHHVVFAKEYETTMDSFSAKFAQFSGGWSGTGGSEDWVTTYTLLKEDTEPIVLVTRQSLERFKTDYEDYMEERQELENALADAGVDEDKIMGIANTMAERDAMGDRLSLSNENLDRRISFWVWQKIAGQWKNISKEVFPDNMAANLHEHFPFFAADFEVNSESPAGLYLLEKTYPRPALMANKANWLTWFGIKKLTDLDLKLKIEGENILLQCSKNKAIHWEWNGANYELKKLPGKVEWLNNPCSKIDVTAGGDYHFKGNIGEGNTIEMQVSLKSKGNNIALSGEYWYSNQADTKFPVEGQLSTEADKAISFHRMKSGQKRESFDAYFTNCKFEGYWQHLGNMNIEKFELELVP